MKPRDVAHVGITVSSMERSLVFYCDLLKCEVLLDTRIASDRLAEMVQVPSAVLRIVLLQLGNTVLELIEYQPQAPRGEAANNASGALHIAFAVDDVQQSYEELLARGIEFNAPPLTFTSEESEAIAGVTIAYFRDPDGVQLEMLQMSTG